jgi:drug/metabolite transporter (DMT)-like permease
VEPMVTTLLAAPLLGEPITRLVLLGGAIIVLGIYLVNRRPVRGSKARMPAEEADSPS